MENKRMRKRLLLFCLLLVAGVFLFLYINVFRNCIASGITFGETVFWRIMNRNLLRLGGIIVCAALIAAASLSFQTITENKVLTPDMLGIDSIFIATQSVLIVLSASLRFLEQMFTNGYLVFIITAFVMIAFSLLLYSAMLRNNKGNIAFLLLFGVILSNIIQNLISSSAGMAQLKGQQIQQLQGVTAVSITNMNEQILPAAIVVAVIGIGWIGLRNREYDVMQLGESNAKSLGVSYSRQFYLNMLMIALDMAVVTALIGPLSFMGLLGVSLGRKAFKTYRHSVLLTGSLFISVALLLAGQSIADAVDSAVPITVFIRIVGGIYLIHLIWKEKSL